MIMRVKDDTDEVGSNTGKYCNVKPIQLKLIEVILLVQSVLLQVLC